MTLMHSNDAHTGLKDAGDQPLAAQMNRAVAASVVDLFEARTATHPSGIALRQPEGRYRGSATPFTEWSYHELNQAANRITGGLARQGLVPGERVVVMLRPGFTFVATVFGLLKMGALPVLIDPGMGMKRMAECLSESRAAALIGIPLAHAFYHLNRRRFPSIRLRVTTARRALGGGITLERLLEKGSAGFARPPLAPDQPAAILFTSGSTGPAKGVLYHHGAFAKQAQMIQRQYHIEPGEMDLPTFPFFALFGPAMGLSCVIPPMNPTRPGRVDPQRIVEVIDRFSISNAFGSPALWRRVVPYCLSRGIVLRSIRRILMAGAPIGADLVRDALRVLQETADLHTPYGATEALPAASASGRELVRERLLSRYAKGAGVCVGRPYAEMDVRVIAIRDDAIDQWRPECELKPGERGEIAVRGPVVTTAYDGRPEATRLAKISVGPGAIGSEATDIWHRMGDVGYFDEGGRLWFSGRMNQRIVTRERTLYTVECEAIFNQHPEVRRSALVGVGPRGAQKPVLIVEPLRPSFLRRWKTRPSERLRRELLEIGAKDERTRDIREFLMMRELPVDVRHNAKIFREKLAVWAARKLS